MWVLSPQHLTPNNTHTVCKSSSSYLKLIVSDNDQLFGPLPKASLSQQEGADTAVSNWSVWVLLGRPSLRLVPSLGLFFFFLVGLVGATQSIRVIV